MSVPAPHHADAAAPFVIGIEATRLAREVRGIGRYVRALIPRMLAQRPGSRVLLFVKPRDVARVAMAMDADPLTAGRIDVMPARRMRRAAADVFWYPWNSISNVPSRGPVVVTMHDVAPLTLPDPRPMRWRKNRLWRARYEKTVRRSTLLVVPSRFTAREIERTLNVPLERMRVTMLAADDLPGAPPADVEGILAALGVQRPFVLTVGAADRRKNLELAERAMDRVAAEVSGVTLVLAGPRTADEERDARSGPHLKRLGFVGEEALAALYRSAECLVMPSRYEGFGLPVLEAMQLGLPVVCARSSSLPEVGGDAVLWTDPDDDAELATALSRILTEPGLADSLRAAGRARAAAFTWDETTRRTLEAFDEAIARAGTATARGSLSSWWRSHASWWTRRQPAVA